MKWKGKETASPVSRWLLRWSWERIGNGEVSRGTSYVHARRIDVWLPCLGKNYRERLLSWLGYGRVFDSARVIYENIVIHKTNADQGRENKRKEKLGGKITEDLRRRGVGPACK